MYEDSWPVVGDYDFNDLVVRYNLKRTLTSDSGLKRLEGTYEIQAKGASYDSGFALRLPGVAASNIKQISLLKNGEPVIHEIVENDVSEAVLIISPNISEDLLSSCEMFRVQPTCLEDINLTFELDVTLTDPVTPDIIGQAPYDPFIFGIDGMYRGDIFSTAPGRGWELHLKQFSGTDLFNSDFYSLGDDASNGSLNYITDNNMPWVINITDEWQHPAEYQDISHVYPDFSKWVVAGGFEFTDWYLRSKAHTSKLYE